MDSKDGVYIPIDLKKKIRKEMKKEDPQNLFYKFLRSKDELFASLRKQDYPHISERILNIINKYLSL